jgi:hypothetical protein
MASYEEISARVRATYGRVPKPCHIAHVKGSFGLTRWIAPNRIDPNSRTNPCPPQIWPHIEEALRHFGMI